MLIDGGRALRLALQNRVDLKAIYYMETVASRWDDLMTTAKARGITLQPVSEAVFQKIGYGNLPDGILGVAPQPAFLLNDLPPSTRPLYLVAEGIEKPGNLGAILRSADAAGVTGVILANSQTDVYNPNVIRASRGAVFALPLAIAETPAVIQWLHEKAVAIIAATPQAADPYFLVDLQGSVALVVGTEHAGLSTIWLDKAGITPVQIPMAGQVDSLNVAQSASILLYEAVRQRWANRPL